MVIGGCWCRFGYRFRGSCTIQIRLGALHNRRSRKTKKAQRCIFFNDNRVGALLLCVVFVLYDFCLRNASNKHSNTHFSIHSL